MPVFCARFLDVISRGNQCSRHDMWAVFSSQCLPLTELAAVYYTIQDLTEISLKGYLFVMLVNETFHRIFSCKSIGSRKSQ